MVDHDKRTKYKGLVLYPSNKSHVIAMDIINATWCYKAILHDKDVNDDGELKKAHWHVIIQLDSPQSDYYVAETIGVQVNYIEQIRSLKSAYDYLTHRYHQDKYQYNDESLFGDLEITNEAISDNRFKEFTEIIYREKVDNPKKLVQCACRYNYLDILKKNSYLFLQLIKSI